MLNGLSLVFTQSRMSDDFQLAELIPFDIILWVRITWFG
jgi:hypothetical protein